MTLKELVEETKDTTFKGLQFVSIYKEGKKSMAHPLDFILLACGNRLVKDYLYFPNLNTLIVEF